MRIPGRQAALLSAFVSLATGAPAAELIKVPGGIVARTLFDWEGTVGLEGFVGSTVLPGTRTGDGSDVSFSADMLCRAAAYRTLAASGSGQTIDLNHLCADNEESVTFALIADTQELHDEHRRTAELLADLADRNPEVRFVITAGDIVDRGNDTEWRRYREVAEDLYTYRLPIVPVIGNHEYFDDSELKYFDKVYKTPTTQQGYYALDLGPAVLIVLNSNIDQLTGAEADAQTAWLASTLTRYESLKPMLVTYHHPAYATGAASLAMPIPPRYIKRNWLPLFERHGVKLVMNGHEHIYERLRINGIEYINAGPAGGTWGYAKPVSPSYTTKLIKRKRTVSIITVQRAGAVEIRTYSPDEGGGVIDEYSFGGPYRSTQSEESR